MATDDTPINSNDNESTDFLQSMMENSLDSSADAKEEGALTQDGAKETNQKGKEYVSKKPLWWKKVAGKPTKSQKRSIAAMEAFRLPRMEWGETLNWDTVFPSKAAFSGRKIWLEIGFGTGDNLLALAHKFPNRCFVGAEVHGAGLGKLCQRMHKAIDANTHWTDYDEFTDEKANQIREVDPNPPPKKPKPNDQLSPQPVEKPQDSLYHNLRFFGGDGIKLLPYIPTSSLDAILVTFPDPFPKPAQAQYRVVQKHTLFEFHRILEPRGFFYLATDHEEHFAWCHQVVNQVNQEGSVLFQQIDSTDRKNWLPVISKYEQKGWNEGRSTHLSCWQARK